jgi:hypothetical protein
MNAKSLTKFCSLLWLFAHVAGSTVAAGQVLCIGADGHVALEAAHPGTCTREVERHHGSLADADSVPSCAGHPCQDVAVIQPARQDVGADKSGQPTTIQGLAAIAVPSAAIAVAAPVRMRQQLPAREPSSVRTRRSIVLLV